MCIRDSYNYKNNYSYNQNTGSMGSSTYNDFYSGPGAGITGGPAGNYGSGNYNNN